MGYPPAPVYKGARGRRRPALFGRAKGSRTPTGSRIPPFLVQLGQGGKEGKRGRKGEGAAPPNPLSNSDWAWEGRAPPPGSFPLRPNKAQYFSRIPVTPRYLRKYPNHSELFRCPNIVVQYTDLYVSTISRLLVMSPISSGTPNSFGTSKYTNS